MHLPKPIKILLYIFMWTLTCFGMIILFVLFIEFDMIFLKTIRIEANRTWHIKLSQPFKEKRLFSQGNNTKVKGYILYYDSSEYIKYIKGMKKIDSTNEKESQKIIDNYLRNIETLCGNYCINRIPLEQENNIKEMINYNNYILYKEYSKKSYVILLGNMYNNRLYIFHLKGN